MWQTAVMWQTREGGGTFLLDLQWWRDFASILKGILPTLSTKRESTPPPQTLSHFDGLFIKRLKQCTAVGKCHNIMQLLIGNAHRSCSFDTWAAMSEGLSCYIHFEVIVGNEVLCKSNWWQWVIWLSPKYIRREYDDMRAFHLKSGHFGEINVVWAGMLPCNGQIIDNLLL